MRDIYGRTLFNLSEPYDLSALLASRLRRQLDSVGSIEYRQTWRKKTTPSGLSYWAHTASARRTSDSGCSGWPTPDAHVAGRGASADPTARIRPSGAYKQLTLNDACKLAGWPSPNTRDHHAQGATHNQKAHSSSLATMAEKKAPPVAGWLTPRADESGENPETFVKRMGDRTMDCYGSLSAQVKYGVAGWATPTSRDHKDGNCLEANVPVNALLGRQCLGATLNSSTAATGKCGALNSAFSRWLMGYPWQWDRAAILASRKLKARRKRGACGSGATETQSCPSLPPSS